MTDDTGPDELEDPRLLACGQFSVGGSDLSLRQPAVARAAGDCACEAHVVGALGHHARAELFVYAFESRHQEIRSRHDLHVGAWAWWSGRGERHVFGRHLQRGIFQCGAGSCGAEETVHAILVSRRYTQPCVGRVSGVHSRRRRAGLFAEPRLRRGVRQSGSGGGLRRGRRRGGDGTAGDLLAFQ
jgi:hypothetical protein